LVNSAIPADRLRFTLAHELGHIFMHRVLTDDMEKEADRFAAEFLMPERDIRSDLTNLSLPRLATLKQYWRVSMAALLYRAAEIGTISPRTKQYLWFQMGKNHFRTHEPVVIPREDPTLLRQLFDVHVQQLGYTVGQFGKMLFVPSDDELIRRHISTHGNHRGFGLVK
jgi:Zn-dependent peptidase ImmA (M78 family)